MGLLDRSPARDEYELVPYCGNWYLRRSGLLGQHYLLFLDDCGNPSAWTFEISDALPLSFDTAAALLDRLNAKGG